jgi:hypothetical protein
MPVVLLQDNDFENVGGELIWYLEKTTFFVPTPTGFASDCPR